MSDHDPDFHIEMLGARLRAVGAQAIIRAAMMANSRRNHSMAREWLEEHGTSPTWGQEPWRRSATDGVCPACGRNLGVHPEEYGPGYGSCGDQVLHLRRDCQGRLHHL